MTIEYKTLAVPPKDWCFSFTYSHAKYGFPRNVSRFWIKGQPTREDAYAKLREYFSPHEVTNIHLLECGLSKFYPQANV